MCTALIPCGKDLHRYNSRQRSGHSRARPAASRNKVERPLESNSSPSFRSVSNSRPLGHLIRQTHMRGFRAQSRNKPQPYCGCALVCLEFDRVIPLLVTADTSKLFVVQRAELSF
jgi:hypothetical protein